MGGMESTGYFVEKVHEMISSYMEYWKKTLGLRKRKSTKYIQ